MSRSLQRVAFVGDYVPRRCGIATFTRDLRNSVAAHVQGADCLVVAVNDTADGYDYPPEVRFEVPQHEVDGYRQAADFIRVSHADVVCVQHEYGIYGGGAGSHILALVRRLSIPVVTTLHTVLESPADDQQRVLVELARLSTSMIVMSERGRRILETQGVPPQKIEVIPHGVPDVPFVDPNFYKDLFGVEGRKVVLTFGLLSPGKGIEYVLHALPKVIREIPDVVYIVVGATHPNLLRSEGDTYRASLVRLARRLGVQDHVVFDDRYVTDQELREFLGAADVYVTPYLNPAQITSGTLSYAFGCGKAVVSTPYWHAEELLADGRGFLVPFRDADALAASLTRLLSDDALRNAVRKHAYLLGREMVWSAVAARYAAVFLEARATFTTDRKPRPAVHTLADRRSPLPDIRLQHLKALTDGTGVCQHAIYRIPNYREGYSTDDNARALMLTVLLEQSRVEDPELSRFALRYAAFLDYAYDAQTGRFRNFLSFDRRWLDARGSDDGHGRALWALGAVVGRSADSDFAMWAARLFAEALPQALETTSPRAWAFALLGVCDYARRFAGDRSVRQAGESLQARLLAAYRAHSAGQWRWFEPIVSYANARLCHALIVSGAHYGSAEALEVGIESLRWLRSVQTADVGHFRPVGTNGFYPRGGTPALYDQQPLEASCVVSASLAAFTATQEREWLETARGAFDWFLGNNDLGVPVYDPRCGGCHDGLHIDRINQNMGAESTLAFLMSLVEMRLIEQTVMAYERSEPTAPPAAHSDKADPPRG